MIEIYFLKCLDSLNNELCGQSKMVSVRNPLWNISMKPEALSSLRNYFPRCLLIAMERWHSAQAPGSSRALCLHKELPLAAPVRAGIGRSSITDCYSQPVSVRGQYENSDGNWQLSLTHKCNGSSPAMSKLLCIVPTLLHRKKLCKKILLRLHIYSFRD